MRVTGMQIKFEKPHNNVLQKYIYIQTIIIINDIFYNFYSCKKD